VNYLPTTTAKRFKASDGTTSAEMTNETDIEDVSDTRAMMHVSMPRKRCVVLVKSLDALHWLGC
jgi:hypothetical protein